MELALQTSGTYEEVLEAATWAEEAGLAAFALPDHYIMGRDEQAEEVPAPDALIQLAGLARETSTIELVILVSPITFRHPAVLAKTAITLDRMSGGRFVLGVGAGWMESEHETFGIPFPERAERFEMLEDALGYLEAALAAEPTAYKGKYYSLDALRIQPRPIGRPRLLVGGTGSVKTPRLAGRFADEYNCYLAGEEEYADRLRRARDAAHAAGRDPANLKITTSAVVIGGVTQADYEDRFGEFADEMGMDAAELRSQWEAIGVPGGTYDQVREALDRVAGLGAERLYVQHRTKGDLSEIMELFDAIKG